MKISLLTLILLISIISCYAQNYPNILNYSYNGTPTYGIKIKTNIPYTSGTQMPTITITGYNYGSGETLGLTLVYYIYSGYFTNYQVTSFGKRNPPIFLSNENGKVVIFINDRQYYLRFTVSAFAQGMSEQSSWFQGWSTADEALSGSNTVEVAYASSALSGNVSMPGGGIWNSNGNVGIGTSTPHEALSVNGTIRSKEVKVETTNWPDYVFKPSYQLPSLTSVKTYIDKNQHLPDMPSELEVTKDGVNLGEMNKLLLKKVEELTLYLIDKDKEIGALKQEQQNQIDELRKQVETLLQKKQ